CNQTPVTAGGRTHIEDRQKIRLCAVGGTGPCVEVIARRFALRMQGCSADTRTQEQVNPTASDCFYHRVSKADINCCQRRGSSLRRSRSKFKRRTPTRQLVDAGPAPAAVAQNSTRLTVASARNTLPTQRRTQRCHR